MRFAPIGVLVLALLASHALGKLDALYGVQAANRAYYEKAAASGYFTCLDGSRSNLQIDLVNDGYCDCDDGTDEPGTAACSYQVNFPEKWRFQCQTAIGEHYKELFHSRINDGICDCCDGSDEYDSWVRCSNHCAETAEREEREAEEREQRRQLGLEAKKQLEVKGEAKRAETLRELTSVTEELAKLEAEIAPLESKKREEEQKEQQERDEIKAKSLLEKETWDAEQASKRAANEAAELQRKEAADLNPEIQRTDDGTSVRFVCSKWRQTKECKGDGDRDPYADKDCDIAIESGWSGYCECFDAKKGLEVKHPFDCAHPRLKCDFVCAREGEPGMELNKIPPGSGSEDAPEEPQFQVDEGSAHKRPEAEAARVNFNSVNNKRNELQRRKTDLEAVQSAPYFEYPALLALKGECYYRDESSYAYSLCLYDRISQGPRGNRHGGGTNMGEWHGFGAQTYASWGAKHDTSKMKFQNGQFCYGGPSRSVEVSTICGPTNEILSVQEPSMCTYTMVFQTPAACE